MSVSSNKKNPPRSIDRFFAIIIATYYWIRADLKLEAIYKIVDNAQGQGKIVDNAQGQGENRFKSGAYTLVFEHFESVFNTALGR